MLADRKLSAVTAEARRVAQERRERVVQHDDLRKALKDAGFRHDCWNGYVPPRHDAYGRSNDAQQRVDLIDICAEALRREQAA